MWDHQSRPGLIVKNIQYESRSDHFRVTPLSDIHTGSEAHDEKLLKNTVAWIAEDPLHYTLLGGDVADLITRKDIRYHPADIASWLRGEIDLVASQIDRIDRNLSPLKGRTLAYVLGNHEDSLYRHTERDVYAEIGNRLKINPEDKILLGHSGFIRLSFTRKGGSSFTLVLYVTHGWWGGRLMGVGALNLERIIGDIEADIILAGHDHNMRTFRMGRTRSTAHGIRGVPIQAASCGHFLSRPLYGQAKGYKWKPPGTITINIWPDKKEWNIEVPSIIGT